MIRRSLALASFAFTFQALAAGAQVKQQGGNGSSIHTAINKAWDDAAATFKSGNTSAMGALYTDDAMMLQPGMPTVSGRANIEKVLKGFMAGTKFVDMTHKSSGIFVTGDIAIDNGTYTQTLQEKGKPPMTVDARYELVFKNVNGKWLVLRDVTVPMPPTRKQVK